MKSISAILLFAVVLPSLSLADTLVVPRNAQPNNGAGYVNQGNGTTKEYQELIPSVEFGTGAVMEITQFAWRSSGGGINEDVLIPSLEIRLSTTALSSLSPVLPDNINSEQSTVFSGPYLLKAVLGNPNQVFNVPFSFTKAFKYAPAQGNLLIDLVVTTAAGGRQTPPLSFGLLNAQSGLTFAAAGQPGQVYRDGPVTQFTFSPVPEPKPIALLGCGLLLLLKFKRK